MSAPHAHRASILHAAKAQLKVEVRKTPSISPDEVLVKVTATAINPVDWKLRDSMGQFLQYPAVLGSDAAGEVVGVGDGVADFNIGDRVFFQGMISKIDASTFQEYCKMPACLVAKTPSCLSDEHAGGISLSTMAAATALYSDSGHGIQPPWSHGGGHVGRGRAIVILGGSSSVGQYAIQLARISGFDAIITNSSRTHFDALQKLGATVVLDRSTATAAEYASSVGGLEVSLVLDTISIEETQILGVDILQRLKGGDVVTLLPSSEEPIQVPHPDSRRPVQTKRVTGLGWLPEHRHLSEPLMKAMGGENGWLSQGIFRPNRIEIIHGGLEALEVAFARSKEGVSGIKLIVLPSEQ